MSNDCTGAEVIPPCEIDRGGEASLFMALGDEKRLRMLDIVAANPGICACTLIKAFDMSQSTLSHHMSLLRQAGLVMCEKRGRGSHYTLSDDGFRKAIAYCNGMTSAQETARLQATQPHSCSAD